MEDEKEIKRKISELRSRKRQLENDHDQLGFKLNVLVFSPEEKEFWWGKQSKTRDEVEQIELEIAGLKMDQVRLKLERKKQEQSNERRYGIQRD